MHNTIHYLNAWNRYYSLFTYCFPCQVECVCNVCSSIVFINLWIITNYVEVWQITAICAVNETHSDGLRILGFLEKREEKYICFFFHSDWGLLLKRTYNRCIYQPRQISPRNKYHMNVLIFKQKCYLIMSEISIHLQEEKNSTHFCCCCKIPYHSDGMIQSWVHYIQYTMMYALASTATTSVSWLQQHQHQQHQLPMTLFWCSI